MRAGLCTLGWLAAIAGAGYAAAQPAIPAGQLVREVIYNEQNDHQHHGYWRYWVERHTQAGTSLTEQVETAEGPVARLALSNGHALNPEAQVQEQERLHRLLNSPGEQARNIRQFEEDEERIGRILALLPDAFVYEYDGEENGCYRLSFRPNPNYTAHTIEARIFHAMSGTLWVDARSKRLATLEGRVGENVDFGFGILGRLCQGGWFRLERVQVSPTEWKTKSLEVHMNMRALMVKSFARDTSETRGDFTPVPSGMSLVQGVALLDKQQAQLEAVSAGR